MSISSFEAEAAGSPTPHRPLLADEADEVDVNDEEIVSQLLSANERSHDRRRCRHFPRRPMGLISLAVVALVGLFGAVFATCSCNLLDVEWNPGGVELSISAVGIWSYQKEVVAKPKHNNDNPRTKRICVDYGANAQSTQAINMEGFFPSSKTLQAYSILGPSFFFAAIVAMLVVTMLLYLNPEVLDQSRTKYPIGIVLWATAAAILLLLSGIFQLLSVNGLHYSTNTNEESPICNAAYSACKLGTGGHWAVVGILSSFVCGIVWSFAVYFVGCQGRRGCRKR